MNPRSRSTRELVAEYFDSQGGCEAEDLEFKAQEKVEDSKKRRELVKIISAMANSGGGTIIIGVGEGRRGDIIQTFDSRSEIQRDLIQTARDNTKPSVGHYLEQSFDEPIEEIDASVLRIDIHQVDSHDWPIKFVDSGGEAAPWFRSGDTTKEMNREDVIALRPSEDESSNKGMSGEGIWCRSKLNPDNHTVPDRSGRTPEHRIATSTNGALFVPTAHGLRMPFDKSALFHLETDLTGNGLNPVFEAISAATEQLSLREGVDFGYGIHDKERQIIGQGVNQFQHDLQNIGEALDLMGRANQDDPRPTAVGAARCQYGLFWVQTQLHTGSFMRNRCGFIMEDVPFDSSELETFFERIGSRPEWYEQSARNQVATIHAAGELADTRAVHLCPDTSDVYTHIDASNPFYGQEDAILRGGESGFPEHVAEAVASIERLPYRVRGGWLEEDEKFRYTDFDLLWKSVTLPTFFVNTLCGVVE